MQAGSKEGAPREQAGRESAVSGIASAAPSLASLIAGKLKLEIRGISSAVEAGHDMNLKQILLNTYKLFDRLSYTYIIARVSCSGPP